MTRTIGPRPVRRARVSWRKDTPVYRRLAMDYEQCAALTVALLVVVGKHMTGRLAPRRVRSGEWHTCEVWVVMHYWSPPNTRGGCIADGNKAVDWAALRMGRDNDEGRAFVKEALLDVLTVHVPGLLHSPRKERPR